MEILEKLKNDENYLRSKILLGIAGVIAVCTVTGGVEGVVAQIIFAVFLVKGSNIIRGLYVFSGAVGIVLTIAFGIFEYIDPNIVGLLIVSMYNIYVMLVNKGVNEYFKSVRSEKKALKAENKDKKSYKKLLFVVVMILVFGYFGNLNSTRRQGLTNINRNNYIEDKTPFLYYKVFLGIEDIYFKAGATRNNGLLERVRNFQFAGYVVLADEEVDWIKNNYDWSSDIIEIDYNGNPTKIREDYELAFPTTNYATDPYITGFTEFNWVYSEEFEMLFNGRERDTDVYFDTKNNIVYFLGNRYNYY